MDIRGTVRVDPLFQPPPPARAMPSTAMTHIAIVEALDGKTVDWMTSVGDEDDLAATRAAD
jgi:hypothetical protein